MSAARCVVLPPGAAHRSSTRSPGRGSSAGATSCEARDCTVKRPAAQPGWAKASKAPSTTIMSPSRRPGTSSSGPSAASGLSRSATSEGSLSAASSARVSSAPSSSHQRRTSHSGCEWRTAAPSGRVVRRQLGALPGHAAQDRVDQAMAGTRLGQLHRLGDRGVVGHAVEEQQLEEPELQRGADGRLEPASRPPGDDVVERQAALDRAEGQLLGQRAVARVQGARLAVQRPVGVGALGEDAQHDRVRGAAGGADGGRGHTLRCSSPPAAAGRCAALGRGRDVRRSAGRSSPGRTSP